MRCRGGQWVKWPATFSRARQGRAIYQAEPFLPEVLDDHAALRRTPKGSFAHAYCDFMEREGLSATGFAQSTGDSRNGQPLRADGVEWYGDRLRDTHDILHILTGYGRDPLGEQCVFAFMFDKRPSPGAFSVILGWNPGDETQGQNEGADHPGNG